MSNDFRIQVQNLALKNKRSYENHKKEKILKNIQVKQLKRLMSTNKDVKKKHDTT